MLVYSGRPDPEWTVDAEAVQRLDAVWAGLSPVTPQSSEPKLGYRGIELRQDDGVAYLANAGFVTRSGGSESETRADAGREFERTLIATAPAGVLPPGLPGPDSP
jgi:hypothetical protein